MSTAALGSRLATQSWFELGFAAFTDIGGVSHHTGGDCRA